MSPNLEPQVEDFISNFHNLPGNSALDKHQNLYKLIRQTTILKSPQILAQLVTSLQPQNHFETILHIGLLIHFKRFHELYPKFQSGNEIAVKKLIKHKWFLDQAFMEIAPKELVCNVFPTLSYPVRLKILNRIVLDDAKADEIFDLLLQKYNKYVGTFILHQCSSSKIRKIIDCFSINFTRKQVEVLYKKDPVLMLFYLEQQLARNPQYLYRNNILRFLAQNNPLHFLQLVNKYHILFDLGRRTTKRVVNAGKSEILTKPKSYLHLLQGSSMVRTLGEDFEHLYRVLYENDRFKSMDLLKKYDRRKMFSLYKTVYEETYGRGLEQKPELLDESLLKMIIDPEKREKFAKIKHSHKLNSNLMRFYRAAPLFNEFLSKFDTISSEQKCEYVKYITISCTLNNDTGCFSQIVNILLGRIKNENTSIVFIKALRENRDFLKQLDANHWKLVYNVILFIYAAKKECWETAYTLNEYLEFLIKNNQSINAVLRNFHDSISSWNDVYLKSNPNAQKRILESCLQMGFSQNSGNLTKTVEFDNALIHLCEIFNKEHSQNKIDVWNERILNSFCLVLKNQVPEINVKSSLNFLVRTRKTEPSAIAELKQLYFEKCDKFGETDTFLWFIQNDPELLFKNFDAFLNKVDVHKLVKTQLVKAMKKLSCYQFDTKLVQFFTERFSQGDIDFKKTAIVALVFLAPSDFLANFVHIYEPISDKINKNDETGKIQLKLTRYFKYIEPHDVALRMIFKFCIGNYLRLVLRSLYKQICNLPEPLARIYIGKINDTPFKQHALHLSALICDNESSLAYFKVDKSFSLNVMIKYFEKRPDEDLWVLIKLKVEQINPKKIVQIQMPKWHSPHTFEFLEIIWNTIVKQDRVSLKVWFIKTIMANIWLVKGFKESFATNIIIDCLFTVESVDYFVFNLLFDGNPTIKFSLLEPILKRYKYCGWELENSQVFKIRQRFSAFIQYIFKTYMAISKLHDSEVVNSFYEKLSEIFSPTDALVQFMLVTLMKCKLETPQNAASIVISFNNDLYKMYKEFTLNLFADVINNNLDLIFLSHVEKFELCHEMFMLRQGVHDDLLILRLLPQQDPDDLKCSRIHKLIVTMLKNERPHNELVKLQLNFYLNPLSLLF